MAGPLSAFRIARAELGLHEALWYGLGRLLQRMPGSPALFRYALMMQPIVDAALPARRGKGIDVRLLSEASPELVLLGVDLETQRYRYAQQALCFAAFQGRAPVGCLWICIGPYEEDEVRCRFIPLPAGRTSWDLGVYVLPSHRAGFVFARLWGEANTYLRERHVQATLSRIATVNRASMAAHTRLGARRIGTATFLRLGHAQIMIATVRPYFHVSLSPAQRPELHVFARNERVTKDSPTPLG